MFRIVWFCCLTCLFCFLCWLGSACFAGVPNIAGCLFGSSVDCLLFSLVVVVLCCFDLRMLSFCLLLSLVAFSCVVVLIVLHLVCLALLFVFCGCCIFVCLVCLF